MLWRWSPASLPGNPDEPKECKEIYALYKVRFLMALVQWWSGVSSFLAASLPRVCRCVIPEGPGLDLQLPGLA
jgi:hypothetical protein